MNKMKNQLLFIALTLAFGACVIADNTETNDSKLNRLSNDTTSIYAHLSVYEVLDSVDQLICADVAEKQLESYKKKAIDMLEVVTKRGDDDGLAYYGCELIEGYCLNMNINKGLDLLKQGIEKGNDEAMFCTAEFLFKNEDIQHAIELYELAASLNHEMAALDLASIYLFGKLFGVSQSNNVKHELLNPEKGLFYLKKSANLSLTVAKVLLGELYLKGYDGCLEVNKIEGEKLLKEALKDSNYTQYDYVESILNSHLGEGNW
jgi:TPR repeat protein